MVRILLFRYHLHAEVINKDKITLTRERALFFFGNLWSPAVRAHSTAAATFLMKNTK